MHCMNYTYTHLLYKHMRFHDPPLDQPLRVLTTDYDLERCKHPYTTYLFVTTSSGNHEIMNQFKEENNNPRFFPNAGIHKKTKILHVVQKKTTDQ